MRSYRIDDSHSTELDTREIVKNSFGETEKIKDGHFVVPEPRFDVVKRVEVIVEDDVVKMDIEEISVDVAFEEELLDEVPTTVKSKNDLLRQLTGRTVSDRKADLRKEAVEDIEKASHPSSGI